ncbi:IS630 family transposase ISMex18 [Methylobacterium mesophilicum]|nr:IS630 family transposase ISMex18 [Methylobacterium mesophilicum]
MDEKPQIQALTGTASVLPMQPGQPERRNHDYRRQGTTNLFAALDVRTGTVIFSCTCRHRSVEFRAYLDQVEASMPRDLDVHLMLDNAATHKTQLIHDWLVKRPRWYLHFTPTSASWLNLVEGWFALPTRQSLQRGAFERTDDLEAAIHDYINHTNADPKPFVCTKPAEAILASVGRFCQRISNSHH